MIKLIAQMSYSLWVMANGKTTVLALYPASKP